MLYNDGTLAGAALNELALDADYGTRNGVASVTLGAGAVSAAGAVVVAGSASIAAAAATVAASGALPVAGALSATSGVATLSAAGQVSTTGALSVTTGAATISATGISLTTGYLTTVEDGTLGAFACNDDVINDTVAVVAPLPLFTTISASGGVLVQGALTTGQDGTLNTLALNDVEIGGTVPVAEPMKLFALLSATAITYNAGNADIALSAAQLAADGAVPVAGALVKSADASAISAAGVVTIPPAATGSLNKTLGDVVIYAGFIPRLQLRNRQIALARKRRLAA